MVLPLQRRLRLHALFMCIQLELKELQKALKELQDSATKAAKEEKAQAKLVGERRRTARAAQQHAHEQARTLSGF